MLDGETTACHDRESVSLLAVAGFAVCAGRCGDRANASARRRRCSAGRQCVECSHGGDTAHLLTRSLTLT